MSRRAPPVTDEGFSRRMANDSEIASIISCVTSGSTQFFGGIPEGSEGSKVVDEYMPFLCKRAQSAQLTLRRRAGRVLDARQAAYKQQSRGLLFPFRLERQGISRRSPRSD